MRGYVPSCRIGPLKRQWRRDNTRCRRGETREKEDGFGGERENGVGHEVGGRGRDAIGDGGGRRARINEGGNSVEVSSLPCTRISEQDTCQCRLRATKLPTLDHDLKPMLSTALTSRGVGQVLAWRLSSKSPPSPLPASRRPCASKRPRGCWACGGLGDKPHQRTGNGEDGLAIPSSYNYSPPGFVSCIQHGPSGVK